MGITINDVAREAGVSKSTVSRVIANNSRISEETKKKVKKVIDHLGYQPNITARNLAKSRTKTLGVVLPIDASDYFGNPIYIQMMQGMSLFAQEQNYFIMYVFGKSYDEEQNIREFSTGKIVDGIIILKTEINDHMIKRLQDEEFPFVVIGKPNKEGTGLWVDNDNKKATYDLTKELIENGHQRIAFISAKEDWMVSQERLSGYKEAILEHGLTYDQDLIYCGEAFSEEVGFRAMKHIFKVASPSAMVATDDIIAVGINRYLQKHHIQDKVVIGFNNTALAIYQNPPLSSVEIQGIRLGYEAAKLLVSAIEKKVTTNYHKIIDTKLIRRGNYQN